jgi:O-antigen/teichoic acid export membrane protein
VSTRLRIAVRLGMGQVLGRGALAIYTILMVRELSRTGYGEFAYALALAGIFISVGDAGFGRLVIRDVARAPSPGSLVREMLLVRAGAAVLVAGVFAVAVVVGAIPFALGFTAFTAAYLLLETLAGGYEAAAVGAERPFRFVAVQAASAVALTGAGVLVIRADRATPEMAMAGLAAASSVRVVVAWLLWHVKEAARPRPLRDLPVRQWIKEALPFFGLTVLAAVYYRVGVVILHGLEGPVETAPYAAALRVFDGAALLGGVAFAAVSPAISRIHVERPDRLWAVWKRMVLTVGLGAAALTIAVVLLSSEIAGLLFGGAYEREAGRALALLAPGMGLLALQNLTGAIVLMGDEHGSILRLTVFNVAVAIAISVALSASFGSDGAAAATSLAELLSFTTFAVLVWRMYRAGDPGPRMPQERSA